MRSRALAVLCLLVGIATAGSASARQDYVTHRDLFLAVDLPSEAQEAPNGEFIVTEGADTTTLAFMASTPHFDVRRVDCGDSEPAYKVSNDRLFAWSCELGDRIRYHIEKYGRTYLIGASNGTETIEFTADYPASKRAVWDPIIAHMSRSLRFAR
ncbi:MAG: hypothetical protein KDE32_00155 [Novosphingobium sp.]|nr:hypothetical protein [Novosphingobium sp.]